MTKTKKLWSSMQAASMVGLVALVGCEAEGEAGAAIESPHSIGTEGTLEHGAEGAEGEGSEGEGAEGEGTEGEGEGEGTNESGDLANNDLGYLTQLALVRGHLFVGNALYQAGHDEHAETHMKHPEAELYSKIVPAFKARGTEGFAAQLSALADAVETRRDKALVQQKYTQLQAAIAKSEAAVHPTMQSTKYALKRVVQLLRVAAEEYAIAVVDGKMQNAHEYQDALGFTTIAKDIVDSAVSQNETESAALASAKKALAELEDLWPALIPPDTLNTEAAKLYGTASRIEIISLSL